MTALATAILTAQPREKAGPRTGARFAFQHHASLAKLLDLHEEGVDYRALFDHFDDLTILVGADEPTAITFYQIKGKDTGAWTTSLLCRVEGAGPRTMVGKMYHHTLAFASMLEGTVFLTNAEFRFELATGGHSTPDHAVIAYSDLGPNAKSALSDALEHDFPAPRTPDEGAIIRFERTLVPLRGYDTFLRGRLVELLGEEGASSVNAVYKTLITEVVAKTNDTTECALIAALYSRKSLCREDLEKVLCAAQVRRDILAHWDSVESELRIAGRNLMDRIRMKTAVTAYWHNRSKRVPDIAALHSALRDVARTIRSGLSEAVDLLSAAAMIEGQVDPELKAGYDRATWEAALLVEAFDAVNGQ